MPDTQVLPPEEINLLQEIFLAFIIAIVTVIIETRLGVIAAIGCLIIMSAWFIYRLLSKTITFLRAPFDDMRNPRGAITYFYVEEERNWWIVTPNFLFGHHRRARAELGT